MISRLRYAFVVRLTHALAKRRRSRLVEASYRAADLWRRCVENRSYEAALNGEEWLVRQLPQGAVVFDVGANLGHWTDLVLDAVPDAQVHAFELMPDTAAALLTRMQGRPGVVVNPVGLSDAAGTVQAIHFPGNTELSTILASDHSLDRTTVDVEVVTGDSYCAGRGIDHIDLLKVDAEGADLRVLRGFDQLLAGQHIGRVQFEYGGGAVRSHDLLADFYEYLGGHGYAVGKLFPTFIRYRDYDPWRDEDLLGPNYVAEPKDRVG